MYRSETFEPFFDAIPDYAAFPDLDTLNRESREQAEAYPDIMTSEVIGMSAEGRPIVLDKINDQPGNPYQKRALYIGYIHPNEAIGSLTVTETEKAVCENPEIIEHLGDCALWLMKCADPDGMAMQGWIGQEFTLQSYTSGFFRPKGTHQLEWGFPIDYKGLRHDSKDIIPEIAVLQRVIAECRPDFLYPLHNAALGSGFLKISHNYPELLPKLHEQLVRGGVPGTNPPEDAIEPEFHTGIYQRYSTKERYDALAAQGLSLPSSGGNTLDYAREYNPDVLSLIPETPYFMADELDRPGVSDQRVRDVSLETLRALHEYRNTIRPHADVLRESPCDERFIAAIDMSLAFTDSRIAQALIRLEHESAARKMSHAEVYDEIHIKGFYRSLFVGMLERAAESVGEDGRAEALADYRTGVLTSIEAASPIQKVPIRNLVRMQSMCGLLAMEHHFAQGAR